MPGHATLAPSTHVHDVFISYSRKDRAFARRLDKALRDYRPPRDLDVPQRNLRVFLDEEDFTGVEYRGAVARHLKESARLVVLCSPHARLSQFVDDEIVRFADSNGVEHIIPILVSGLPNNEATPDQQDQMAFPAALCERMEMPLAVDYRALDPAKDKPTSEVFHGPWYTTLANIYGTSRDSIEQREKKRNARRRRIVSSVVGGVITVLLIALVVSLLFWRQAVNQRTIAVARQLAAQAELVKNQQVDFIERSMLLATESMRRSPSLEADLVLRPQLALLARPVAYVSLGTQVADVAFSRDGRFAANGAGNSVTLWDMMAGRAAHRLMLLGPASSLAFSPDGKLLAIATGTTSSPKDSGCEVWDLTMGNRLARIGHDEPVREVVFSADGRHLASRDDKVIRVSEVPSGRLESAMSHERTLMTMRFSQDARWIAASTNDNDVHRWDLQTGREVPVIRNESIANAIAFSPDGTQLATTGSLTRIWDWATGVEVSRALHGSGTAIAFTPDGETLAAASGSTLILSDVATGRELARMPNAMAIQDLAISPDGASMATASNDDTSRIWTLDGQEVTRLAEAFAWRIAFDAEGTHLLTANRDGIIRRWQITNGAELAVRPLEYDAALPALSVDGTLVATADTDHVVRVRDLVTGRESLRIPHDSSPKALLLSPGAAAYLAIVGENRVRVVERTTGRDVVTLPLENAVTKVTFAPDGGHLAAIHTGNGVRVWEIPSGKAVGELPHDDGVDFAVFNPDGTDIVTATINTNKLFVWEVGTTRPKVSLSYEGTLASLTFDPRGRLLAAANLQDEAVQIWDATAGWQVARVVHPGGTTGLVFSPDGQRFVTVGLDETTRVWGTNTLQQIATLMHPAHAAAFSADGAFLATAGADGQARVWEVATAREVARLEHRSQVLAAVFTGDGRYLATVSNNAVARMWFMRPADLVAEACARLTRNITSEEWRQYVGDEPYRPTCPNLPTPAAALER